MDMVSYLLGKNAGGGGGGGGSLQELNVTPTDQEQVLLPQEGYVGFSQVTVAAIQPPVVPPEAGALVSLVVGTLPKVSYVEGDPLDLTGCVILANYSNGYQLNVTAYCTFTCNNPVTYYDTAIAVSYTDGGVTATLSRPITVAGAPVLAPASTLALYHLDGNYKDEVSGETDSGGFDQRTGKFNYACAGYVSSTVPNLSKIRPTQSELLTGQYTIELWGRYNDTTAYREPVRVDITNNWYLFSPSNVTQNGLTTSLANSSTIIYKPSSFNETTWHHYAITFDGGTYTTYLDGKKSVTGSLKSDAQITKFYCSSPRWLWDEILFCNEVKYVTDFEPPHAPYYLANQGGE